ncbi:MAG: DUF86 domain-containing protein [Deltaproteobacteria bacterium]|jgi:uncharacterized protein with HEPN domain|nr:DUF86 domain-containing protein [Deltaproteobacteria bacterium]
MNKNKNIIALELIITYCDRISGIRNSFNSNFDVFKSSHLYIDSIGMNILQIGELTTQFTDDFKLKYTEIPWKAIKQMRNIFVHHYVTLDINKLWNSIIKDIPILYEFCRKTLILLKNQE